MEVTTKIPLHKPGKGKKIVLLDFGVKYNIVRSLQKRDCDVHILPAFSSVDEIMAFCKENLTGYKRPHEIEFRDSLPKTTVGKILRRQLVDEEKKKAGG